MKKSLKERFQKLAGIKSVNKLTEQPIPDKDRDDSIYTDPNPDRPGYVRPTGIDKPGSDDIEDPRPDRDLENQRAFQYGFNPVGFNNPLDLEGLEDDLKAAVQVGSVSVTT